MNLLDRMIVGVDRALRVVAQVGEAARRSPAAGLPSDDLSDQQRRESAALMRVNHAGEVSAQALYDGQALFARNAEVRSWLHHAGREEADHLAWTADRIKELDGRVSWLMPFWYAGAWALGAAMAARGDAASMGFLKETERQVVAHLERHLNMLPVTDLRSRAIVQCMRDDEAGHAREAEMHGAAELPAPIPAMMRGAAKVMTSVARYV